LQKRKTRVRRRIGGRSRFARLEASPTVLANHLFAKIFNTNLKVPAASGTLLNIVRRFWHNGISYYPPFHQSSDTGLLV
jgi:hypothetical protein